MHLPRNVPTAYFRPFQVAVTAPLEQPVHLTLLLVLAFPFLLPLFVLLLVALARAGASFVVAVSAGHGEDSLT